MKKKLFEKNEEFQEGEIVESWSKIRIVIAAIIVIFALFGSYYIYAKAKTGTTNVLGAHSDPKISSSDVHLPSREDAEKLLETAKNELNNLTSDNLVSSQAALQKIINDLKNLQDGKGDPVETFCELVCKK